MPEEQAPRIEALGRHHDRASFSSGVEALDTYIVRQASQDARRNLAAPFVLVAPDGKLAGYYTLSSTSVALADLPAATRRKLPRYPDVPATLLGRLAVDRGYRGRGYGRLLLADAVLRGLSSEIASFAIIVDAKNDEARRFYLRESFLSFPDQPGRLFLPMAAVAKLFA